MSPEVPVNHKAVSFKCRTSSCCLFATCRATIRAMCFRLTLRVHYTDIKLTPHGPSVNGFGLFNSEVDLDLSSTGRTEVAELLGELSDKITQDEGELRSALCTPFFPTRIRSRAAVPTKSRTKRGENRYKMRNVYIRGHSEQKSGEL